GRDRCHELPVPAAGGGRRAAVHGPEPDSCGRSPAASADRIQGSRAPGVAGAGADDRARPAGPAPDAAAARPAVDRGASGPAWHAAGPVGPRSALPAALQCPAVARLARATGNAARRAGSVARPAADAAGRALRYPTGDPAGEVCRLSTLMPDQTTRTRSCNARDNTTAFSQGHR